MKTMQSKFRGQCSRCQGEIRKGEQIAWSRATGALHSACSDPRDTMTGQQYRESGEDYPCSDRGYEDQCAAACGGGL